MAKTMNTTPKVVREPETVSISFRNEKEVPKDFEEFDIDDEVQVVVIGKIYSTNRSKRNKQNDYSDAAQIRITQDKVKVRLLKEEPASLKDAVSAAEEKRKM